MGLLRLPFVLAAAFRKFRDDDGLILSAAVAFFAVLSLVPLLSLVISVFGLVQGSSQDTLRAVLSAFVHYIPHLSEDIVRNVETVVSNRQRLSWWGLISLLVAAELVVNALEFALDRVFAAPTRRSFWRARLLSACVVVATGFVLLFSSYVGAVFHAVKIAPDLLPVDPDVILALATGLHAQYLMSVALVLASISAAMRILPHVPVSWGEAVFGGVIGTILWEGARRVFLWYLANLAQFDVVYGSLGALIAVMVWIYVSATIFVFAAECVVAVRREPGPST